MFCFALDNRGWQGSVARFWQRSYAADYLGFALLVVAFIIIQLLVEPFHRMFSLDDRSKSYPHAIIERVSTTELVLYTGMPPLLLLLLWCLVWRPGTHQVHVSCLGFFVSLMLTAFLTDVVKNAVGRPRPDLIARCKPKEGTPAGELVTISVCTETDHHLLQDGWRSFPSGHSSFSFAGLGYLTLVLSGQLHIFRPRADLARCLFAFLPLLGAAWIAMSRLEDYRHDVYDVTAGSILGIGIAYFSYRRFYRSLRHRNCDIPYPERLRSIEQNAAAKRKDEEHHIQDNDEFELADMDDDRSDTVLFNRDATLEQDSHV